MEKITRPTEESALYDMLSSIVFEVEKKQKKNNSCVIREEIRVTDELSIKPLVISGTSVIAYWNDGTVTKSRSMKPEAFDAQVGLSVCICKKLMGKDAYYKAINTVPEIVYEENTATKKNPVNSKNTVDCSCGKCACNKNKSENKDSTEMSKDTTAELFSDFLDLLAYSIISAENEE